MPRFKVFATYHKLATTVFVATAPYFDHTCPSYLFSLSKILGSLEKLYKI